MKNHYLRRAAMATALLTIGAARLGAQPMMHCHMPDPKGHPREHVIDIEHMFVDVALEPAKKLVKGEVTHTFVPIRPLVDSIFLDGPGIKYSQVQVDGKDVRYRVAAEGVYIFPSPALKWDAKHTLKIRYEANPKRGIYFIGWNDSTNRSRKQIWTQGQGIDNRHWIPCFDDPNDKVVTEVRVTVPEDMNLLSNGKKLAEKKNKDGSRTWQYRISKPHSTYLLMLGAGQYAVRETKSASKVPISSWYYPDQPDRLEPTYRYTERIMDFLEAETGVPYPWESYSQIPVQDFLYGAMENTTATVFGDFFYNDSRGWLDRPYVGVNAHEMTHQWFGDLISAKSYDDQWLQESFATYYAKLAERSIFGEDYYQWNRRGESNTAFNAAKENSTPVAHTEAGSPRIYQKGSYVLDMLNYVIGRDEYRKAVKAYLEKYAYKNVTTFDFQNAFHDVLGRDLDWFFEQWINKGGEPHYRVSYEKGLGYTDVVAEQIQKVNELTGYFRMPIAVEVYYKDGTKETRTEWVDGASTRIRIPNTGKKEVEFVLFDPNSNVLKQLTFTRSFEELLAQVRRAPNMIDRYDALVALRGTPADKKRALLTEVYNKESFHALRSEVISQLAPDVASASLVLKAVRDRDHRVRLTVAQNFTAITEQNRAEFVPLLTDSSYMVIESAMLALNKYAFKEDILTLTKDVKGMAGNVRLAHLKIAYEFYKNSDRQAQQSASAQAIKEIGDMAGPSFEFRTRINAFAVLQQLNYLDDPQTVRNVFDAVLNWNGRLARPASEAVQYFAKQNRYQASLSRSIESGPYTEAEKETLRKLLK